MPVVHRIPSSPRRNPAHIPFDPRRIRVVPRPVRTPVPEPVSPLRLIASAMTILVNLVGFWLSYREGAPPVPGAVVLHGSALMLVVTAAGILAGLSTLILRSSGPWTFVFHLVNWAGLFMLAILRGAPLFILAGLAAIMVHAIGVATSARE